MMLKKTEITEIRKRAERATPGPWHVSPVGEVRAPSPWNGLLMGTWATGDNGPDAKFVAHAREDIPALLDTIEELYGLLVSYDRVLRNRDFQFEPPSREMIAEWKAALEERERAERDDHN